MRRPAARLDLGPDRPGHLVPGQQLRRAPVVVRVGVPAVRLFLGVRVLGPEHVRHVVEHEPLALGVAQHAAVTAHRLGDEQAGHRQRPDHVRGVELHELHVQQRSPGQQGQRVPVAGVLPGVGRDLERLADAAGGQHHRGRLEQHEPPGVPEVPERAGDPIAVLDQLGDRGLGEDLDHRLRVAELDRVLLLQRDHLLLQGPDHLQAGPVTDVRQPRVGVPAEVPLADLAVLGPVEHGAPRLELPDPVRGLLGVQFGHPPVVEELAAAHRVAEVDLPVVVRVHVAHGGGAAALGHHRVRLAEQGLGDDRGLLPVQPGLDRRAQPGAARADHHHVVGQTIDVAGRYRVAHNHSPFGQLKILGSENTPAATSQMYRSVSISVPRVIQANCRCRAFSHDTRVQIQ